MVNAPTHLHVGDGHTGSDYHSCPVQFLSFRDQAMSQAANLDWLSQRESAHHGSSHPRQGDVMLPFVAGQTSQLSSPCTGKPEDVPPSPRTHPVTEQLKLMHPTHPHGKDSSVCLMQYWKLWGDGQRVKDTNLTSLNMPCASPASQSDTEQMQHKTTLPFPAHLQDSQISMQHAEGRHTVGAPDSASAAAPAAATLAAGKFTIDTTFAFADSPVVGLVQPGAAGTGPCRRPLAPAPSFQQRLALCKAAAAGPAAGGCSSWALQLSQEVSMCMSQSLDVPTLEEQAASQIAAPAHRLQQTDAVATCTSKGISVLKGNNLRATLGHQGISHLDGQAAQLQSASPSGASAQFLALPGSPTLSFKSARSVEPVGSRCSPGNPSGTDPNFCLASIPTALGTLKKSPPTSRVGAQTIRPLPQALHASELRQHVPFSPNPSMKSALSTSPLSPPGGPHSLLSAFHSTASGQSSQSLSGISPVESFKSAHSGFHISPTPSACSCQSPPSRQLSPDACSQHLQSTNSPTPSDRSDQTGYSVSPGPSMPRVEEANCPAATSPPVSKAPQTAGSISTAAAGASSMHSDSFTASPTPSDASTQTVYFITSSERRAVTGPSRPFSAPIDHSQLGNNDPSAAHIPSPASDSSISSPLKTPSSPHINPYHEQDAPLDLQTQDHLSAGFVPLNDPGNPTPTPIPIPTPNPQSTLSTSQGPLLTPSDCAAAATSLQHRLAVMAASAASPMSSKMEKLATLLSQASLGIRGPLASMQSLDTRQQTLDQDLSKFEQEFGGGNVVLEEAFSVCSQMLDGFLSEFDQEFGETGQLVSKGSMLLRQLLSYTSMPVPEEPEGPVPEAKVKACPAAGPPPSQHTGAPCAPDFQVQHFIVQGTCSKIQSVVPEIQCNAVDNPDFHVTGGAPDAGAQPTIRSSNLRSHVSNSGVHSFALERLDSMVSLLPQDSRQATLSVRPWTEGESSLSGTVASSWIEGESSLSGTAASPWIEGEGTLSGKTVSPWSEREGTLCGSAWTEGESSWSDMPMPASSTSSCDAAAAATREYLEQLGALFAEEVECVQAWRKNMQVYDDLDVVQD